MDNKRTFSKEEISRILTKASKIQAKKELYGEETGLTEEELVHIAEEVGIDKDSLFEAIQYADTPELNSTFNWFTGSTKIQDLQIVDGKITEDIWEKIVQDIRRITGGIGKVNKVGKSFEWEQRMKEIGYKHITISPQNENSKIQFISNWMGLNILATVLPFIFGAIITGIFLDGTNLPEIAYLLIPLLGGIGGIGLGRIYLRSYFEKQKSLFKQLILSISKRADQDKEHDEPVFEIDMEAESRAESSSVSPPQREKN